MTTIELNFSRISFSATLCQLVIFASPRISSLVFLNGNIKRSTINDWCPWQPNGLIYYYYYYCWTEQIDWLLLSSRWIRCPTLTPATQSTMAFIFVNKPIINRNIPSQISIYILIGKRCIVNKLASSHWITNRKNLEWLLFIEESQQIE